MPRKQKKYHYIYKTTNLLSGKYYIGMHSTSNLEDGYMGSGKRLRYSINKYGKENHKVEILEFLNSREELAKRENEIVNLNEIAKKECMNLRIGGKGGFAKKWYMKGVENFQNRVKNDSEFFKLISERSTQQLLELWKNPIYRKKILKNIDWTGKKHKEKTKKQIGRTNSIKQKGNKNSQFGTQWITDGKENKKIKKGVKIPVGWRFGAKFKII